MAMKSPVLLHWNDEMKGTAFKTSGSSALRNLSPRFHHSFISTFSFPPVTFGLRSFSVNGSLAYTNQP